MARRVRGKAKPYQVFLSYSHQDRWIAQVMKEKIEGTGIKIWLDVFDLPGGAIVGERVAAGIWASDECLVLLSPASRVSDWVRHEIGMAAGMKKWTTLILLHVGPDAVPDPVRPSNYLSINDFDSYCSQLADRKRAARSRS
jgi:hypothetical protein